MNTIYLTQVVLDPYAKEVRRALEDRYALHRIAYSLKGEGQEGRLLWRLEPVHSHRRPVLLVQTPHPPVLEHVLGRGLGNAETRRIELRLSPGTYAFRLEANAVRRRERRARPLLDPEEQVEWLVERLAPMTLLSVIPVRTTAYIIRKPRGTKYPLHAVLFEGRLSVPEGAVPDAARKLRDGVGRARSMGMGMLSLKRVRSTIGS